MKKLIKIQRYLRWRFAPGARAPMWWHVGRPNFGDDMNPQLFERLTGIKVRLQPDRGAYHLLGMGSILEKATPASVVCGSGFLREPTGQVPRPARLVALRGELSLAAFPKAEGVFLGDPAVLLSEVVSASIAKRHRVGFVPHITSVARWRQQMVGRYKLIDPADSPWRVIEQIAECEIIISQSLHGLIAADALGIPNVWIAPSDDMAGGRFKFDDYFTTIDSPKEMVSETPGIFRQPSALPASLGRYLYDKQALRAAFLGASQDALGNRGQTGEGTK